MSESARRWRRFVAAALLAGGALVAPAAPASAASPNGAWTQPAPHSTHAGDPLTTMEVAGPLQGYAQFENGIAGVTFSLATDAADPGDPCSAADSVPPQVAPGSSHRVDFSFDASFPCNRRYQVQARATPRDRPLRDDSALVLKLWVDVALPPAKTKSVTAEIVDRTVVVRWDPVAPVPDLAGYQVRRAIGDGNFRTIGEVGPEDWEFVDEDVPSSGAVFHYQVRAMRPAPDGSVVYGEPGEADPTDVPALPVEEPDPGPRGDGNPGVVGSGAGDGPATTVVRRTTRPSTVTRRTTPTTLDTGYEEALPFQPRPVEPVGDPAVVVRLPDVAEDDTGQRQTLLLIAGGTTAFSWAMLLRFVNRKAMVF